VAAPTSSRAKDEPISSVTGGGIDRVEFRPLAGRVRPGGRLDGSLLERATDILDDLEDTTAQEEIVLAIESLRCVVCELWITAAGASQHHQSILAILESFLRTTESVKPGQLSAVRGAFADLTAAVLSQEHVDINRSRFIDEGYSPLSCVDEVEHANDGANNSEE